MRPNLTLTFLGGLGDIGRNCAVLETSDSALLIDCGLMFPSADMPGVDLVLPDFSYLQDLRKPIVGCVITHGHEDHHGALSFLLQQTVFPIYGSAWSLALAGKRLEEAGLIDGLDLIAVGDGDRVDLGEFEVEFVPVAHSVPDGFATVIRSQGVTILHTGDWKLDLTPTDGRLTDFARIGSIATGEGIDLLLADSTNADEPGYCESEAVIRRSIAELFREHRDQRVLVACFASHIHRIQQVIDAAASQGRSIATLGMSMRKNVDLAIELGLMSEIPNRVDIADIADLPPHEVCVLATGSQGEPMSALSLIAGGRSRWLDVIPGDLVIFSTTAISGNELGVSRVMDGLARRGASVVHSGFANVHTSGHAKQEDLKLMLTIANPKCLIPVHGEHRHLAAHAQLARSLGWDDARVVLCEDGSQVRIGTDSIQRNGAVSARYVYVDGDVGPVGPKTLRDRSALAETGVLHVTLCLQPTGVVTVRAASTGWVDPAAKDTVHLQLETRLLDEVKTKLDGDAGTHPPHIDGSWFRRVVKSAAAATAGGVPTLLTSILNVTGKREAAK